MVEIVRKKYKADSGTIHPIRVGADIAAIAANSEPSGEIMDGAPTVKVSKTVREFGIKPRHLVLFREFGTPPDIVRKYKIFPIFDLGQFTDPAFNIGTTIKLGTVTWTILDKKRERST